MNNEKKIIDKIIADANSKAQEILTEAQLEVSKKIEAAELKAKKELDAELDIAKVEAVKAKAKEISSRDMIAKKKILETKQQLIDEAIKSAKEKLLSLGDKEVESTIIAMLKQANVDNTIDVILSQKYGIDLKNAIENAGYKISSEIRDISGGFILKKGDIEYNYSFEAIIAVQREELEQIAAKILFN